jgi:hypothetical protein
VIKPQAQPGLLVPFLIDISLVEVEANKTKENE